MEYTEIHGKIKFGKNAGKVLNDRINLAKDSIRIMSPYLSEQTMKMLLEKHRQGVSVNLITSSEAEGKYNFANLIKQVQTTDEVEMKRYLQWKLIIKGLVMSFIVTVIVAIYFKYNHWQLYAGLFVLGTSIQIMINKHCLIKTYKYNYLKLIPFKVLISSKTHPQYYGQNDTALCHTKLYIVDDYVITGSFNFTMAGMYYNLESSIYSKDHETVNNCRNEFDSLFYDCFYKSRDIRDLGRKYHPKEKINPSTKIT